MRRIVTVLTLGLSQALSAQGLPDLSRIEPTPPIAGRWNLPVQSGANVNGRLCAISDSAAAAAVRARLEAWVRQTNDGDGAGARDVWATNVVEWLPRAGIFSDSAARAVAGISAATGPARVRYQLSIEDVAASGPIVAVHDIWTEVRTWATVAVERVIRGSELWRCQPDGQWRIVRYVSAPEPWRRVPRFAGLAALPALGHAQSSSGVNRYVVTFDTSGLLPRIAAEVTAVGGRLLMPGWGADMHVRGWAEFIRDLVVEERDGRRAAVRPDSGPSWTLADTTTRPVRLRYAVDLSFTTVPWPYGNEQAGMKQGRDVFVVSKALFITTLVQGPRHVRLSVPPGWHVAAPWPVRGSRSADYVAESDDALLNNSIVVGPSTPVEISAGAFTFVLAALGETAGEQQQLASALRRIVPEYVRVFPGTPETRYVLTVFRAAERDAEAFQSSAAFSEVEPMTATNRLEWAGTIAHEVLHSWNGARIRPEPYADLQWVSEGFTDYLATRTLARTGVIDERLFMRRMEHTIAGYLYFKAAPAFRGVTLKAAGARKGPYRLGVYNGGWVAAFCLDTDIRRRTAGARGIDDVLRTLFEQYGLKDRPYTESDLRRILVEVGGESAARFLDEYALGNAVIPIGACLEQAGYRGFGVGYKAEYYVEPTNSTPFRKWLVDGARNRDYQGSSDGRET